MCICSFVKFLPFAIRISSSILWINAIYVYIKISIELSIFEFHRELVRLFAEHTAFYAVNCFSCKWILSRVWNESYTNPYGSMVLSMCTRLIFVKILYTQKQMASCCSAYFSSSCCFTSEHNLISRSYFFLHVTLFYYHFLFWSVVGFVEMNT